MDEPSVRKPSTIADIHTNTGRKRKEKDIGAPSQHAQPSRKGKKAWRKNVNITEIEAAMEGMREEERVTGWVFIYLCREPSFMLTCVPYMQRETTTPFRPGIIHH